MIRSMGLTCYNLAARFFSDDTVVCMLIISAKKYSMPYWCTLNKSFAIM